MGREGYREAVDDDVWSWDVFCFGEGGFGADEQGLCFATIELEEIPAHPAPDVLKAGGKGGGGKSSGGFGGDIDLCIIGIAVKVDPMMTEDCAQGEEIDDK